MDNNLNGIIPLILSTTGLIFIHSGLVPNAINIMCDP